MLHSFQLQPIDIFFEKSFSVFSDNRRYTELYFQRNSNCNAPVANQSISQDAEDTVTGQHQQLVLTVTELATEVTKCPKPDKSKWVSAELRKSRKVNRLTKPLQGMATSSIVQIK